jgi:PAS domain S-box-containing protein
MLWTEAVRQSRLARSRLPAYLALTLVYVIVGRLGLFLAVPPGYATAIFPPAGIAMAAAFIGGRATLPWTFCGSFILNLWAGYSAYHHLDSVAFVSALIIAPASMLQAAIGGWALRRLIGYPTSLDTGRDLTLFFASVPVLCLTSGTLSLSGMATVGAIKLSEIGTSWITWWVGDTLGVLLFLPLVMVMTGEPRAFWRSRALSVALPMLLFFALFVAIFIRVSAWENDQSLLEFRLLSQEMGDTIEARLGAHEVLLEQLSASFRRPARLSRRDFGDLVQNLLTRIPSIQAVEWAPRIEVWRRQEFEAAQKRELSDFEIRDRNGAGQQRRADDRAEFYPITYLEPIRDNEAALGFDLASDPTRRAAIVRTIDSGAVTATAPIRLVQEPSNQAGLLLMLAVPDGVNGAGIVLIVMRMDRFMDSVLGQASQEIGFQLIDQDTGQSLFDTLSSTGGNAPQQRIFGFGARTFALRTAPTSLYFAQHRDWQSWGVLIVGVLSTSLLGALFMLSTGERQRFARLLAERTRERDSIWQVSEDLLGVGNFEGYFISTNPAWTRTLGWSEDEIKTMHVAELRHPEDAAIGIEGRKRLAEGVSTVRMENRFRHKDGTYRWIYWTMTAEKGMIYLIGRNVTADKAQAITLHETEEKLRQSQKMEAVGQLTGGIAHDFNNLLTVIIGSLDIIERSLGASSERVRKVASAAMAGAVRAATLTQRLLAFAQKQPLKPAAVDVNKLVEGMSDLVSRTLGETIHCDFALGQDLPLCFCDANQLETALLNLVINARDAMPHGGHLKIKTDNIVIDASAALTPNLEAGSYVRLTVSDTGVGMSRDTLDHAFEPFFTTKSVGQGTGLGLSMVYGFVKQSKGHVEIDSVVGSGTSVNVLLPQLAAPEGHTGGSENITSKLVGKGRGTGETILVVEDDADVRAYIGEILRELDYTVLEADSATDALAMFGSPDSQIDLLLTDVVMPGLNGRELVCWAKAIQPNVKVLFMTGYSRDAIVHQGRLDSDIELIEKPFRRESLAVRIRAILDSDVATVPFAD